MASWLLSSSLPSPPVWLSAPVWLVLAPALAAAFFVDWAGARRGLEPPARGPRRWAMGALLALVFAVGVFYPLAWVGRMPPVDLEALKVPDLFFLHAVLVIALLAWFQLGYGGRRRDPAWNHGESPGDDPRAFPENPAEPAEKPAVELTAEGSTEGSSGPARLPNPPESPLQALARTCGLRHPNVGQEVLFGLALGPFLWLAVILVMAAIGFSLESLGGEEGGGDWAARDLPELVVYMAGLPVAVRLGLSLSAGVVEEIFFRGFLQKRVGVGLSTLLFVLAHLTYDAPLMLVGVTLLSLAFAALTKLRGNVWAAVAAHTFFDAVQLLWLVPKAVDLQEEGVSLPEALPGVVAFLIC